MLSRKPLGVVGAAMLGIAALFGASVAHAVINLDSDTKSMAVVTYAKETLLSTETVEGNDDDMTYYQVDPSDVPEENLNVEAMVGLGGFSGSEMTIAYQLHGMVFADAVALGDFSLHQMRSEEGVVGGAINLPADNVIRNMGAAGDSQVTFIVQRPAKIDGDDIARLTIDMIAVSGGTNGSVTMTVTASGQTHMSSYMGAVRVANALKESPVVEMPTATVAERFLTFGGNTVASAGSIWVSVQEGYLDPAGDEVDMVAGVIGTGESSFTFSGDFSFASMVRLDTSEGNYTKCMPGQNNEGAAVEPDFTMDLLMREDGEVTNTMELDPATAATIGGGAHLCISVVDPDGEDAMPTPIPATGKYMVTTKYTGIDDAAFPPSGGTYELGYIMRDGTTVRIPYLTQFANYNQRIVIVNRGGQAFYSFDFTTEGDGATATPGADAEGMLAAGATTYISLRYDDLVTIEGSPNRASATLIIEAQERNIDVLVSQTNAGGSTDTVLYTPRAFE